MFFGRSALRCASAYNLQFTAPLDDHEISGIARSIAKWTYVKFTKESFNEYVNIDN
ncbi:TPA: primase C-terminal domain-containing protein [Salmonella enterica subsp. enterica serovar Typhi str. CT18]|uniref:Uncharacterized protein n=1 Tax=Salmonella enterica I TaxID=59201 RepID=A0A6X8WN93_SALET|nr:hypothetical protein [Salmonella enterica subsp. enterica serovar Senftenberg]ECX3352517.1 hypothetical protein [Salmonella enterica subsp. enterica serovar Enteritidis]EDQ2462496.1 hypothetical protein [Salmonella enterica subsp. enterica serovar Java]EHQ8513918.1 primase C-terminal domain-containing protein [Escherichia coli]EKD4735238.1 primase C-terminal domain-containing protein [Salmonella enterica subsp. enterica serovar Kentucky]MBY0700182.1 primase C-terminal domain-containing prot